MNKVLEKLKSIKHIEIILAAVAVAVMIFIYFYSPSKQKSENENKYDYCQSVTVKLQEAVRMLTGDECKVVINWESGVELITAQNTTQNGSSLVSQVVVDSGGAVVVKEVYPKAIGVVVVCKKLNSKTKAEVTIAVSKLMDIQSNRVVVLGSNK